MPIARLAGAMTAALLLLATACAGQDPADGPTPPPSLGADQPVGVVRTGGFAGVHDTIDVDAQGNWTRVDKPGAQRSGRLDSGQRDALRALVSDPRLSAEATASRPPTGCRDAFDYTVTVQALTVSFTDCAGDPGQPEVALAIVRLLDHATPS